jgi:hypothetical protein
MIKEEMYILLMIMKNSYLNPMPLLFKALLHGQKDHIFFSGHLNA